LQSSSVIDLTSALGCSENPVATLVDVLKKGGSESFTLRARKSVMPLKLLEFLASKYGYKVRVLGESGEVYEALVYKQA